MILLRLLATAVVAALLLPGEGRAQQEAVPMDLVRALMPSFSPGEVAHPQILVGQLPEAVEAFLALPPEARVLGSAVAPRSSRSVVAIPADAPSLPVDVEAHLTRTGWTRMARTPSGGFESSITAEPTVLCRDDGSSLSLVVVRVDDEQFLHVYHNTDTRHTACQERAGPRSPFQQTPIPLLRPPAQASVSGSGWGGGGDRAEAYAEIRSDLGPEQLLRHYAGQLREHGWSAGPENAVTGLAVQAWQMADSDGDRWYGMLAVTAVPQTDRRDVLLRLTRAAP